MRSIAVFSSAFALAVLATGAQSTVAAEPAEVQALSRAKLSLTQAIETAERHGDGKAIDAEFDGGRGEAPRFEVKILGRDKLTKYTLDADSGKVLETSNEPLEKLFTRLQPDDIRGARTTLAQAIGVAEQSANAKAIDAEVDREGDSVRYEVTIVKSDGSEREMEIDGVSGKIVEGR
jgi:uncharacterized membrane protein YkoI